MRSYTRKLQEINLNNLLYISKLFKNINFFIFYGTLLGMERNGTIIEGDDDIDILIDINDKNQVLSLIKKTENLEINENNSNKYFVQLNKTSNNILSCIDLYFYINEAKNDYIIEKHNFLSFIENPNYSIHIPKDLIFPLKYSKLFKEVKVPNKPDSLCKYLYGPSWKSPLRKNSGYRMEIIDNKPKLIKRSKIGSITRYLKYKFTNQFKKN